MRTGSVTFWAWTASIVLHLIVLTAFELVKFSQSKAQGKTQTVPMAKVKQVKKLIRAAPIIPKPKVKRHAKDQFVERTNRLLPANRIFDPVKPASPDSPDLAKLSASTSDFSAATGILPQRIEFFGSWTDQRKVCYVVDCSGSMRGIFGRVQKKLKDSIASLQPDQYFYIIFFAGNRLFESGNGRLVRATPQSKSAAYDFIDAAQPGGRTNALAAMERAMQVHDSGSFNPTVVYFLTDGFELTMQSRQRFSQIIANLLKRFAPTTRINTIGFWPQSDDRKMLETIAKQSGGEFVLITDGNM